MKFEVSDWEDGEDINITITLSRSRLNYLASLMSESCDASQVVMDAIETSIALRSMLKDNPDFFIKYSTGRIIKVNIKKDILADMY